MENRDNRLYGVFNSEAELQQKIDELKLQGYSDEDMYVVSNRDNQLSMGRGSSDTHVDEGGSWWDKFKSFMLGEDLVNDGFNRMGFNDQERDHLYSEMRSGKLFLYVDKDYGTGLDTYDNSFSAQSNGYATAETAATTADETVEERLELHEERLNVDKTRVQTGEVNVNKHVVENEQTVEVPVEREEVYVERRPVDRETGLDSTSDEFTAATAYQEDGTIHIPVSEEQVEVTKKDVVTEEIVIGKRKVLDTETVTENVRHEEVDIDDTTNSLNQNKDRF